MELLQLKYFKTVAEVGKISAAAEQLFISAPALSTAISRLEKELGIELADMIHYIVAIAAINDIDLSHIILEKDKKASIKYHHDITLEDFLAGREA